MNSLIKKYIRPLTPIGIILSRNGNRFMQMYDAWKAKGEQLVWDNDSKFKHIISIEGFGATGASAVQDLFREYDGYAVLGSVDYCGSLASPTEDLGEIDFLRHTGGLLQMSQCFDPRLPKSQFWDDAMIKLFIDLAYFSTLFQKVEQIRPYFYKFIDEIVAIRTKNINGHIYNPTLDQYNPTSEIYTLKALSINEFYDLSRKFITTILNQFYKPGSQAILLDQLFADCGNDMDLFRQFVPNLKRICVYRDPRDVYCIARKLDLKWMPHDTVDDYITWVKIAYGTFQKEATDYMAVRFEDLIFDYDNEVRRIENYIDARSAQHTRPLTCFNPEVSKVSVQEWSRQPYLKADFDQIATAFPELCYTKVNNGV